MFCGHCGTALNGDETVCPNCQNPVHSNGSNEAQVEAQIYNSPEEIKTKIGATGLLVWSIVELICCNQIFGIIAVVLYCTLLQNEIKAGNLQGAMKAKKTIVILLSVGIALGIIGVLVSFFGIGMMFLSEL